MDLPGSRVAPALWHEWREAPASDYAVLGDPISHSKSPAMHAAAYRAAGLDLAYKAIRVPEAEFGEALERLAGLGIKGVNCTVPLKGAAFAWCRERAGFEGDALDARPTVSVNTIDLAKQCGISTDEPGFLRMMETVRPGRPGTAALLGAGGTAQALARSLAKAGFRLRLWNRTPGRWDQAAAEIGAVVVHQASMEGVDVVINATSAGLGDAELPILWDTLPEGACAIDLLYGRETAFLAEARRRGIPCWDGALMLMEQGALSFEWWLGIAAPRQAMLEALSDGHS